MRNYIIYPILGVILFLCGYLIGARNAICEFARLQNAVDVMFLTSIYRNLEVGDIGTAKRIAASATDGHILAIQNIENHPVWLSYFEMLPWNKNQNTDLIVARNLTDAQSFFSQHPKVLMAESSTYLETRKKQ